MIFETSDTYCYALYSDKQTRFLKLEQALTDMYWVRNSVKCVKIIKSDLDSNGLKVDKSKERNEHDQRIFGFNGRIAARRILR